MLIWSYNCALRKLYPRGLICRNLLLRNAKELRYYQQMRKRQKESGGQFLIKENKDDP